MTRSKKSSNERPRMPPHLRLGLCMALVLCAAGVAAAQHEEDNQKPAVRIVRPANNDVVRGKILVEVGALDELGGSGIAHVELLVNGNPFGVAYSPADRVILPWDSRYASNGTVHISAKAVDVAGNADESDKVDVLVDNTPPKLIQIVSPSIYDLAAKGTPPDDVPPWVSVTQPSPDAAVSGNVHLEAFALDNSADTGGTGIDWVKFYGQRQGAANVELGQGALAGNRYAFNWNAAAAGDGEWLITARARDRAGHEFVSPDSVRVLLDNVTPTLRVVRSAPGLYEIGVRSSPPVLHDGTVTVYASFENCLVRNPGHPFNCTQRKVSMMDESRPPTVQLRLPNGTARAVAQSAYYAERGLWIGTVAVDQANDGAGTAVIEVSQARDLAGNSMAPKLRAGFIQLADANPGWPVRTHRVMHNQGMTYGSGANFTVHEATDHFEPANRAVRAVRAGRVVGVHPSPVGSDVNVQVRVGEAAPHLGGAAIFEFDSYTHLTNVTVNVNQDVVVGQQLGDVGNYYPLATGALNHVHMSSGSSLGVPLAGGYPYANPVAWPVLNPLFLYEQSADRDPQQANPSLFDPAPAAARTIFVHRQGDNVLLDTPANPVYGPLRLLGEFSDQMNFFARSYPLEVGYWIRPREALGRRMRDARAPYLLSSWVQYDVRALPAAAKNADVNRYVDTATYSTNWTNPPAIGWTWTRYHHAILSNAGGLNGEDADRQPVPAPDPHPNQFWYTRARVAPRLRDNGSDGAAAPVNSKSMFPDGRYRIEVVASDLRVRLLNVGTLDVIVDNFAPHILQARLEQGSDRLRLKYEAGWELNGPETGQELRPAAADQRNPRWINNKADVTISATFSEPLAAPPTLLLKKTDGGIKVLPMVEAPSTRQRVWTATIPAGDDDLSKHLLDVENGCVFGFQGQDLAGNDLDTNPVTIGARTEANGTWNGYEHAVAADWGNRVVDHSYQVRIDTKHDDKPEPAGQLQPGP